MLKQAVDFDKIIQSHSRWKFHLKDAVEQGKSNFTVVEVRNPHLCQFGQWLDSPEGKKTPHYQELFELHRHFHEEAANILQLALHKQKEAALEKMKLGSQFNQLAAKLINHLAEIKHMKDK